MNKMNIKLKYLLGYMDLKTRLQIFLENDKGEICSVSDEMTLYALNGKDGLENVLFDYYIVGMTYYIDHFNITISKQLKEEA